MTERDEFQRRAVQSIQESIGATERLLGPADTLAKIARVSEVLIASLLAGHKLLLFGNGGSAADAQLEIQRTFCGFCWLPMNWACT
jgi:phosphoheptose isomerase